MNNPKHQVILKFTALLLILFLFVLFSYYELIASLGISVASL